MPETSTISRPAWVNAMNALTGAGGASRKSPVEILATAASVVTHSSYAEATGVRAGRLGHWTDGVAAMRGDRVAFGAYWDAHNEQVINLAVSGSLIRDVLAEQIPRLAQEASQDGQPDLVTCGTGVNDILFSAPATLFADLRTLLAAVPDESRTSRASTASSMRRPAKEASPSRR